MNEWIDWSKQIKAIAQTGIAYTKDQYDLERYHQLTELSHRMIAKLAGTPGRTSKYPKSPFSPATTSPPYPKQKC
jgi:signal transduction protein with GAF and PtsI domain